jgi:hypothetical protein
MALQIEPQASAMVRTVSPVAQLLEVDRSHVQQRLSLSFGG